MKRLALAIMCGTTLLLPAMPRESAALEGLEAGVRPPEFSLTATGGERYSTDYFSDSPGAIVFWSTWSPRSAEILEDFRRYHETYSPRGLKILAVNIDGEKLTVPKRQAVLEYAARLRLPFPVLLDEHLAAFAAYGVMAHPSTVVVSRGGLISYTLGGYPLSLREELEDEIRKALGMPVEPPPPAEAAAALYPDGGALQYYNMGLSLLDRGQEERALAAFRRARERDPRFLEPAIMAARIRLAEGKVEAAEDLLRGADPALINRNDLRYLLGVILLQKGKADHAERQFLKLREQAPGDNWGYWGLAMVFLSRGEYLEAIEQLRKVPAAGQVGPELAGAVRKQLVAHWRKGQTVEWETGFLQLFPGLQEVRKRYETMFAASSRETPAEEED